MSTTASTEDDYVSFFFAAALGGLGKVAVKPCMEEMAKANTERRKGAFTIAFAFMLDHETLMPTKDYLEVVVGEACVPHFEDITDAYVNAIAHAGKPAMELLRAKYEAADADGKKHILKLVAKVCQQSPKRLKEFVSIDSLIFAVVNDTTPANATSWPDSYHLLIQSVKLDPSLAYIPALYDALLSSHLYPAKQEFILNAVKEIGLKNSGAPELAQFIRPCLEIIKHAAKNEVHSSAYAVEILKCCGPKAVIPVLEFFRAHPENAAFVQSVLDEANKREAETGVVGKSEKPADLAQLFGKYLIRETGAPA